MHRLVRSQYLHSSVKMFSAGVRRVVRRQYVTSVNKHILIHEEVAAAIHEGKPVVALESTIISHGMPYPQNLETALLVESIIRAGGCVPATVAILDGIPRVGLGPDELERLAKGGQKVRKCSRRDIAVCMAGKADGATTVSGTMILSHLAGVRVFATGGIGGVHRDAQQTRDVSADIAELSRTPVLVVSAGVKSILDIKWTLEELETNGVPVITLGSDEFPAFFSPSSGVRSPLKLDTTKQIAAAFDSSLRLGLTNGMLVAVPSKSLEGDQIEQAIQAALSESLMLNISGRDVTPFLLKRVNELTGGASLKVNIELVKANAVAAASIACELADLMMHKDDVLEISSKTNALAPVTKYKIKERRTVVVIGGCLADSVARPLMPQSSTGREHSLGEGLVHGSSVPGILRNGFGGVGRNVAAAMGLVRGKGRPLSENESVKMISVVGDDDRGVALVSDLLKAGVNVSGISAVKNAATPSFTALLDIRGDLVHAVADTSALNDVDALKDMKRAVNEALANCKIAVVDGNLPKQMYAHITKRCSDRGVPLIFEPTSAPKAGTVITAQGFIEGLSMITPSLEELNSMVAAMGGKNMELNVDDARKGHDPEILLEPLSFLLSRMGGVHIAGGRHIILTLGPAGLICATQNDLKDDAQVFWHYKPPPANLIDSTGAGDCLAGGMVSVLADGGSLMKAVRFGLQCARVSVQSKEAVPRELTRITDAEFTTPSRKQLFYPRRTK